MTRGIRILLALLWAVLGLSFLIAWWYSRIPLGEVPQVLAEWLDDVGVAVAISVFLGLYTVRPLILFPSTILGIASGIMFGPLLGSAVTMTGELAGATLAFGVARVLGRRWVERHESARLARWDRHLSTNGILTVAVMRLVLLPFDSVSYACGLTAIRLRDFVLGTIAGGSCYVLAITLLGGSASASLMGEVEVFGLVLSQRTLVLILSALSLLVGLGLACVLWRRFKASGTHFAGSDSASPMSPPRGHAHAKAVGMAPESGLAGSSGGRHAGSNAAAHCKSSRCLRSYSRRAPIKSLRLPAITLSSL